MNNLLHLLVLGHFPDSIRYTSRSRHDEHSALDFEDVGVPELALLRIQFVVDLGRYHVLNANQAGVGTWAVVENALADVVVDLKDVRSGSWRSLGDCIP
jgi:hypothetical protein